MFIIKLTHICNLKCAYCYEEKNKVNKSVMDKSDLELIIQWIAKYAAQNKYDDVYLVWHGGEPLLLGHEFFEFIFWCEEKYLNGKKVRNGIQTNGILLDQEDYISLFYHNRVKVSVSLDGYKEINDINRKKIDGVGSFNEVIRNIEFARERGISIGISTVIGKSNIDHLIDIYNFFRSKKLNYNILFDFYPDTNENYIDYFTQKVIELFNYWYNDENGLYISLFINLIKTIITKKVYLCTFDKKCCEAKNILIINTNGDLYPCSALVGNIKYNFGNIRYISDYNDINKTDTYRYILDKKRIISTKCRNCEIVNICNNGCFVRCLNDYNCDLYCKSIKALVEEAKSKLNVDLKSWRC